MNYLEECITELKNNASSGGWTNSTSKKPKLEAPSLAPPSPTSPELIIPLMGSEESVDSESGSSSPEPFPYNSTNANNNNGTASYYSSPSFSPYTAPTTSQQHVQPLDSVNHPILPSPALRPLYSPQIRPHLDSQMQINTHNNPNPQSNTSWRVNQQIASATPSPAIQPQQHRQSIGSNSISMASPIFLANDSMIDHEASAALLMLNMDRRGASISEGDGKPANSNERKMGMSVRDLLTS
jgi:hypothetical protein